MALKRLQMTSPSMARRLFLCMVAPVVDYAMIVWKHTCILRRIDSFCALPELSCGVSWILIRVLNPSVTYLLLLHTSGYIEVYYLMPFDIDRNQAKSNINSNQQQPLEPKVYGKAFSFRILGI